MLFTVRVKDLGDEVLEYDADDIYGVIDQLLDDWIEGDVNLPGVFAFLKAEGYDFGVCDEDVNEGADEDLLDAAANAVRTVLHIGMDDSEIDDAAAALEKLAVFLAAIGEQYQIIEGYEDEDKDEDAADKQSESDWGKEGDKETSGDVEPKQQKCECECDGDDDQLDEEHERAMDEDYDY